MSNLFSAVNESTNKTTTENGAKAFKSTLNANVDFFSRVGAMRGKDILPLFLSALAENEDYAIRNALWSRDIRGGAGERQHFRNILNYLGKNNYKLAVKLIPKAVELGRWDDLLVLVDTAAENEALAAISSGLANGDALCAKWMPRKGKIAEKLRAYLQLTPKQYRKTLVNLTSVVETKMCANQWTDIDYSKLPSVASARYQSAFGKHDPNGYTKYIQSLQKGETKINAGALYPYDILKAVYSGNADIANEQWKALPNFVQEGVSFIPVIDVSGSMSCKAGSTSLSCMDVAISLGLYLAERNTSIFKDVFISFDTNPQMLKVVGSFSQRVLATRKAPWGGSTNFQATYDLILNTAIRAKLQQDDLPDFLVVLSDMQFDEADNNKRALKDVKKKFKEAGYEPPVMVFWNLNGSSNSPAKYNEDGCMLVSGFSPSIMKAIVGGGKCTPESAMIDTIMVDRYNWE